MFPEAFPAVEEKPKRSVTVEVEPEEEEKEPHPCASMDDYEVADRFRMMIDRAKRYRRAKEVMKIADETERKWTRCVDEALRKDKWLAPILSGSFVQNKTRGPVLNRLKIHIDDLFVDAAREPLVKDKIAAAVYEVTGEWVEVVIYPTWAGEVPTHE